MACSLRLVVGLNLRTRGKDLAGIRKEPMENLASESHFMHAECKPVRVVKHPDRCWLSAGSRREGLMTPEFRGFITSVAGEPMSPELRDFLAKVRGTVVSVRKKQIIFAQGDRGSSIFNITRGRVRLTVVSGRGKEATIAVAGPGEFLGEACLAVDMPLRLGTARAVTDTSLLKIGRAEMIRVLHAEHSVSDTFIAYLLKHNRRTQEDLIDQLFNSSEKRLARTLLMLSHFGKKGKSETISPKISQETLAEIVGTTRQRVNFFMNRFRKMGFVEYNGGLKVHSSIVNVILHD
jgi:CRP/FNR family transcriptional regulator, cyclic AMP receptor protein